MTIDGYSFLAGPGADDGEAFFLCYDPATGTILVGAPAAAAPPVTGEATALDEPWVITGTSLGTGGDGDAVQVETVGVRVEPVAT